MAIPPNINNPSGFTAVKSGSDGTPVRVNTFADYAIAGGLASSIFTGDLVKPTGTGTNIDLTAAGANPSIGCFHGVNYVDANGDTQFRRRWLSGQTVQTGSVPEATVFDNPDYLFDAQVSGAAGMVNTNVGNTANLTAAVAGNVLTGQSGEQVDQATLSNSSTTQQVKVQSLRALTNNSYGQFARALVSIFLHYQNGITTAF
jgi:hypothetical protein